MNVLAVFGLCFIPLITVFICVAILVKGFSVTRGLVSCALGLLAVIPIAAMQFFVGKSGFFAATTLPVMLVEALVLNGIVEESIKMGVLFLLPAKKMNQKEFFICTMLAGLTIASFENVVYLLGGLEHIQLRFLTAVLIHITCAGLSGLFVYSVRYGVKTWVPFVMAILFHGVYDYFAMFPVSNAFFYFSFAVIAFSIVECRLRYSSIKKRIEDPEAKEVPEKKGE